MMVMNGIGLDWRVSRGSRTVSASFASLLALAHGGECRSRDRAISPSFVGLRGAYVVGGRR